MQDCITERLSLKDFTPAPGQGALAVVAREDNKEVLEVLRRINHWPSMASIRAERAFIEEIGGGCKVPLGAFAQIQNSILALHAVVLSPDGRTKIQTIKNGDPARPEEIGFEAAREILQKGAARLIRRWRMAYGNG
jgi:hydroxymethylbilane synthase